MYCKIFKLKFILKLFAGLAVSAVIAAALLYVFIPYNSAILTGIKQSQVILDRDGNVLRTFLTDDDEWCFYAGLDRMSPFLKNAVIAAEDKRFYSHSGVDIAAVLRAAYLDATKLKIVSGASTIPMQVVKLLEQNDRRNVANKVSEAVKALKMSSEEEKDFVLELYLNIAPFGRNLRGAEAASQYYFGRHASGLSLAEATLLAGLPKAPSYFRPDRHIERAVERRNFILGRMLGLGMITPEQYDGAVREIPELKLQPAPFNAPHFTNFVRALYPDKAIIVTTLDSRMQGILDNAVSKTVDENYDYGITNGSGVIIENATGAIRAYAGSADFFSKKDSGEIDGVRMKRPPGSALKPFIYSIGIEKGYFTPAGVFYDIPADFSGYSPDNYEKNFSGPVSLQEALNRSLNVPAVDALRKTGVNTAIEFMKNCGVTGINRAPGYYGLSFALGSAEISPLELSNAYAVLANSGRFVPYSCIIPEDAGRRTETRENQGRQVLTKEAAYIMAGLLSDEKKLPAMMKVDGGKKVYPRIAWKTGTSFGNKDAWCAGYNPEFTIVIWYGNFSGRSSPRLTGTQVATPCVFDVFAEIYADRSMPEWYEEPANVKTREVCVLSGKIPEKFCRNLVTDLYIPGTSAEEPCAIEKEALIDIETGYEVCAACAGKESRIERRDCFNYPTDVAEYLVTTGATAKEQLLPPHNPACPVANVQNKIEIISPRDMSAFALIKGITQETQGIALKARKGGSGNTKVYWFIDGGFYKEAGIHEDVLWKPTIGGHRISCADETGSSAAVNVEVE
ncbi:MAG: penicillin-binding protein 1C [Planctomycetes bacterium]|nr:penicillin-binding protein 1C [Planctomycetota bacterium]